jgi:hypothetical protein
VIVTELGDYATYLSQIIAQAGALALYPTLHKILSLRHLSAPNPKQILYLDCDTFFFDDVELLFDRYQTCDSYAREEPMTQRSRHGSNSAHLDEEILEAISAGERLQPIAPFNSGIWLMNHGSWRELDRMRQAFLAYVWRLLVGRYLAGGEETPLDLRIGANVVALASASDWSKALPYPSQNGWIIDQVALWLTLGGLSLSHGMLKERDVAQGAEFLGTLHGRQTWVVSHYFSATEHLFWKTVGTQIAQGPSASV